jgi:hypothetical protein
LITRAAAFIAPAFWRAFAVSIFLARPEASRHDRPGAIHTVGAIRTSLVPSSDRWQQCDAWEIVLYIMQKWIKHLEIIDLMLP